MDTTPRSTALDANRDGRVLRFLLAVASGLFVLGHWLRYRDDEGPLFELLWQSFDLSEGLGLGIESTALALICASALTLPTRFAIHGLSVIFTYALLTAIAATSLETWHPELVPFAKSLRTLTPLALVFALRGREAWAVALLVLGAASTFIAHGLEALLHRAAFVDLIHAAFTRGGFERLPDEKVHVLLDAIGVLDLAVATALLITWRLPMLWSTHRVLLLWMAFWGGLTAASRIVRSGEDGISDALIRAPHALGPLAVWALLGARRSKPTKAVAEESAKALGAKASILGLAIFSCSCENDASYTPEFEGTTPAQLRVVWTEDPQHRAAILWSTKDAGDDHTLFLATEPGLALDDPRWRRITADLSRPFTRIDAETQPLLHVHSVRLTDLEPATSYWIRVSSSGVVSAERSFVTAPADDRPFTLLVGSDSRSRPDRRREMFDLVRYLFESEPEVLAFAHGGDYVYHGDRIGEFAGFLTEYEATTRSDGRLLPIIPTRGNHEATSAVFDEAFDSPGDGRGWFATTLNSETVLLTLNTEAPAGGDQRAFLEESLRRYIDREFQIAQYHQPLWPAVKRPAAAAQHWLEPFEDLGLDLALESDGHVLKRTVPIRDGAQDPNGVVYIGEGGLGVGQRAARADRWYLAEPGFTASAHHVWRLRFPGSLIRAEAIGVRGRVRRVLDSARIAPR